MRTPAGKECRFYYEDFNRGRSRQECRLVLTNRASAEWQPRDCSGCSVPAILAANGDPHLTLDGSIEVSLLGFRRRVVVHASCSKHRRDIPNPFTGCPDCNAERPGLETLFK